jgi:hypothetical protein
MDTQKLQNDKLHLIQWITQIQDHALIEKIKSLMSTSNESFQLITEREEIETLINENEVTIDSKIKYEL